MSTPGTGNGPGPAHPNDPQQVPGQPGGAAPAGPGWGQQPPQPGTYGQPGQQPGVPAGQAPPPGQPWGPPPQQGVPGQPWGVPPQQGVPGQPGQPWGPPGQPGGAQPAFGGPARKSTLQRLLPVAGLVVIALAAIALFSFFGGGGGAPEVGDCIQTASDADAEYEVVDCGDSAAEFRVVGTAPDQTYVEFTADPANPCTAFPAAEVALWSGTDQDEDGSVLCAEPVS